MKSIIIYFTLLMFGTISQSIASQSIERAFLKKICTAAGLEKIHKMQSLEFTFEVQLPKRVFSRRWTWHIPSDTLEMDGKVSHDRAAFINDIYWLYFPLEAYHSKDQTNLTLRLNTRAPLSGKRAHELKVQYFGNLGKTPNDAYKIYVNDQYEVMEWSYHKGGQEKPNRQTLWLEYNDYNGIRLSSFRPGPGGFKIRLKNIVIR